MHIKNRKRIFSLLAILTIFITVGSSITIYAGVPKEPHNAYAMWIEPSKINLSTDTHAIGYKFNVTVWVNVTGYPGTIGGWQFKMLYNKAYLNAIGCGYTNATAGKSQFFEKISTISVIPTFGSYNTTHNFAQHGESWKEGPVRGPGYGSLSWVGFEVIAEPELGEKITTVLDISTARATGDTFVLDWDTLEEIPINVYNCIYTFASAVAITYTLTITSTSGGTTSPLPGSYPYAKDSVATVTAIPDSGYLFDHWELNGSLAGSNNPIEITMNASYELHAVFTKAPPPEGARIFVDPPEIIDPTMVPCSTFHINVTIDDVENMKVCEFNLSYTSSVISWIGIITQKVQGKIPSTNLNIDNDAGYIWVRLTYPTPITTSTPTALVTVTFHVEALGSSPLDLHDTKLLDQNNQPIEHNVFDGFFMALIRDVAVTSVSASRTWAYQEWSVDINVTVKNLGNISETFNVNATYDNNLIGTLPVVNLPPNTETTVTLTWNTSGVPEGNYTIKGEASTVPYEYNTTNNIYVDDTVLILTTIHDLAITDVSPAKSWVYKGNTIDINVTAKNLGNVTESFDVKAYCDSDLIGTIPVIDLAPDAEVTLTFTWNTTLATVCHNYTVRGEATIVPFEYNTTNNVYIDGNIKVKILGDINGDGKVDIMDVLVVAKAFGSYPGHERWNPEADLNMDNKIDIKDIFLVAKNYGKTCPL
jgi:hypothetical protein